MILVICYVFCLHCLTFLLARNFQKYLSVLFIYKLSCVFDGSSHCCNSWAKSDTWCVYICLQIVVKMLFSNFFINMNQICYMSGVLDLGIVKCILVSIVLSCCLDKIYIVVLAPNTIRLCIYRVYLYKISIYILLPLFLFTIFGSYRVQLLPFFCTIHPEI
jgi:hypothetical protein